MRPTKAERARAAGFTLLEVLVAFIIAALAFGVMFDGVVGGMRAASVAQHTEAALVLARSRLAAAAAALSSRLIPPGNSEGEEGGGYHWQVAIAPVASVSVPRASDLGPGGGAGSAPKATLFGITVTVSWTLDGGRRQVRLASARMGALPGTGT